MSDKTVAALLVGVIVVQVATILKQREVLRLEAQYRLPSHTLPA